MAGHPETLNSLSMADDARLPQTEGMNAPDHSLRTALRRLRIHEIELTMQNDELRRTQAALVAACDRFRELYELAPFSYVTIGRDGCIRDINLAGTALLGRDRSRLIGRHFAVMVAVGDRDRWHRHMWHVLHHDGKYSCDLELARPDGSHAYCHVDCVRHGDARGGELRLALTELDDGHLVEAERRTAARAAAQADPVSSVAAMPASPRMEDLLAAANLTQTETRVALLIAKGFSTKAVARELGVAPATVNIHRKHVRRKLGIRSRADNLYARLNGLVSLG